MTWFICMIHNNRKFFDFYTERWFTVDVDDENPKEKIIELLTSIRIPCCYGEMNEEQEKVGKFWGNLIRAICYEDCGCDICGLPKGIIETLTIYSLEQGLEKLRLKT